MSSPIFRCGHPRTPENTSAHQCAICRSATRQVERHSDAGRIKYRQRYLPDQLIATRRKLEMLEREAVRLGMTELMEAPYAR